MCDENTVDDAEQALSDGLTRRQLGLAIGAGGLAAWLPSTAAAGDLVESDVSITTPDGVADAYFVHPAKGKHAAVLIWPDILGLRPAFRLMGKRLAGDGYAVLVVNPYYRTAKSPVVSEGQSFRDPEVREKVFPLARSLSPETNATDANAFISWLDEQTSVDTNRGVGTTGYCMGGPMVMRTAAAVPSRVRAGGSFHGGGLVTEADNSPHRLIPGMQASFLIAIASNDDEKESDAKDALREAFADASLRAEIEVYEGALHGWCPPDSPVYHEAQAERAWSRLLALFEESLA
ncbi:MAG: dienelactone hydrolase family protein [Pseudomonadales bacterium]|nr:dienelactone hydrolase family protein [Pseudomonadales bacterium]